MLQNRRRIFLLVCCAASIQALYYIITLKISQSQNADVSLNTKTRISIDTVPLNLQTVTNLTNNSSPITIKQLLNASSPSSSAVTSAATTIITTKPEIIAFANASWSNEDNTTLSQLTDNLNQSTCNFVISNNDTSIYKVSVNQTVCPFNVIEQDHGGDLLAGGHYIPKQCRPTQKLAVIICYRNREQHLKLFLANIHPFLKKQLLDYTIFIVNQHGTDQFNRAALFNVGYLEAVKRYPYDCFIFHDVDLIPEDLRNVYRCGEKPRHMSVAVDKFNYKLLYSTLFGGVTAFRLQDFVGANGYPTVYWGWGGEDDDMYLRVVKKLNTSITRYPIEIARYKMIRTHDHTSGKANPNRHTILYSKYDYNLDGINSTNYTLHNFRHYRLFTLINVTLNEEPFESIRQRLKIKKKK